MSSFCSLVHYEFTIGGYELWGCKEYSQPKTMNAPHLLHPRESAFAPSPRACLSNVSPPPPHEHHLQASLGANLPGATPSPTSISGLTLPSSLGAYICASDSLPTLTEADFGIFPKLHHEELIKPIRRYGAGIAPVDHKAEFVKIDDDDPPSGS